MSGGDVGDTRTGLAAPPARGRRGRPFVLLLAILVVAILLGVAGLAGLLSGPKAQPGLAAWDRLDTRWGTYLSEREWGAPREAVGGDGWGLDYLGEIGRAHV